MTGDDVTKVWVFNGAPVPGRSNAFPSAVFSSLGAASAWAAAHGLTGTLTSYIVDEPAWDRSVRLGAVSERDLARAHAIRQTWGGGEEHAHFENGRLVNRPTPTP